ELFGGYAEFFGIEFHACAVGVVGAEEEDIIADQASKTRVDIGLNVLYEVADVDRTVGVGKRGSDENAGHSVDSGEPAKGERTWGKNLRIEQQRPPKGRAQQLASDRQSCSYHSERSR